jgi:ethanolamine utilization protein EutA
VIVMNVDIGGGTSKIAVCEGGAVRDLTALDVGARLVCFDADGRVLRIEPAGLVFAEACGVVLRVGEKPAEAALDSLTSLMAERLFEACGGAALSGMTRGLLRLAPLEGRAVPDQVSFSGGVAEYIHGREGRDFGDFGKRLADAVMTRMRAWGPKIRFADQGIRATVIGASQHSVQLSGNTIFVDPAAILPLASLPVIVPEVAFDADEIDVSAVASAVRASLRRMDLGGGDRLVAVGYRWSGPATYARLDAFAAGLAEGLAPLLADGMPLVLVGDGDVGGLLGVHCRTERPVAQAVVSIDGISVRELDFIDIGEVLQVSGGVPVVVKSLVFPSE